MAVTTKKPVSKLAAVQRALEELGENAMPVKIQEFLKKLGVEMSTGYISTYKSQILRAKKAPNVSMPAVSTVAAPAKAKHGAALSLQDIETVKGLVGRIGEENLKSLVGLLAG